MFIDNASTDRTVEILRELAAKDKRFEVIVNTHNFGHIRSPYHEFLQVRITLQSDHPSRSNPIS
jgi:Glycosyl transferase family 2.